MTTEQLTALKTWDFSYARAEKKFRFRAGGEEILASEIEGYAFIEEANGQTGHMKITCRLEPTASGQVNLWLEPGDLPEEKADWSGDDVERADEWQLCFLRKEAKWRVWDRALRRETLHIVNSYRGPAQISWHDRGGHIFVHGRMVVVDDVAHFAGDRR